MNETTAKHPGVEKAHASKFIVRSVEPRALLLRKTTVFHRQTKNQSVKGVLVLDAKIIERPDWNPVATLWRVNYVDDHLEYDCLAFECYLHDESEPLNRIPVFDFVPGWMRDVLQRADRLEGTSLATYLWMPHPSFAGDLDIWLSENDNALKKASVALGVARTRSAINKAAKQSRRLHDHRRCLLGLCFT